MKARMIVVLNNDVKLGKVLNAVGHMMVGISPRIPKEKLPEVELYLSSPKAVREFRKISSSLHVSLNEKFSVFSDFAHTTTEGTAKDHETQTRKTKESDINYFASCICASTDDLLPLNKLINSNDYTQLSPASISLKEEESNFSFEDPIEYPENPDFTLEQKKFSIVVSPKLKTSDTIHSLIRSCLILGSAVDRKALRLHQYPDADNIMHPGMSEYGLVVLKAKNLTRLVELNKAIEVKKTEIDSTAEYKNLEDTPIAVAMFGKTEVLNELSKKNISLWDGKLDNKDFLNPVKIEKLSKEEDLSSSSSTFPLTQYQKMSQGSKAEKGEDMQLIIDIDSVSLKEEIIESASFTKEKVTP